MCKATKLQQIELCTTYLWFRPEGMVGINKSQAKQLLHLYPNEIQMKEKSGTLYITTQKKTPTKETK